MSQITANIASGFAIAILNGKEIYRSTGKAHTQQHLRECLFALQAQTMNHNEFSTFELKISGRSFPKHKEEPNWMDGLDMSLVIQANTEEGQKYIAESGFLDDEARAKARLNDAKYLEYMGINSSTTASLYPPSVLDELRDHMREHYPDITLRY